MNGINFNVSTSMDMCVCVTERDGVCEYVSVYYSLSCKSALEF